MGEVIVRVVVSFAELFIVAGFVIWAFERDNSASGRLFLPVFFGSMIFSQWVFFSGVAIPFFDFVVIDALRLASQ